MIDGVFEKVMPEGDEESEAVLAWKASVKILNLGCGNSILPEELYDKGYKSIFNIDISSIVIE